MAPNPAILIAYATSTGTTREIAERIATTLKPTTSYQIHCRPVSEIPPLHQESHRSPPPPPTPPTSSHSIPSLNPLTALITPDQTPVEYEYKAIIIGSSIHAGRWIGPGRTFLSQNHDFLAGTCCTAPTTPTHKVWFSLPFWGAHQPHPVTSPTESDIPVQHPPPKVYAFSVGMPGTEDALLSEQKSVEAALRKSLGLREGLGEEEVLHSHILFRGQWSPRQLDILAPFISRVIKWVVPAESKFMKVDDERDWEGIERWAKKVGEEVVSGTGA